ncbi:Reverse transcriptase (RNA-dependent DNA polymerase) [Fructobacillus sp. EFB-N1]|uniref:RNA-directed DNA polymerase n=1 Tax=Fructobacillus sp. EFB-N1 TaxID=1658766 RepID=UPI00064DE02B|nr:RNA-directed DNA polymerase [Fructobacillus sp. EFB-N1]KMK53659.1 Reverse transcriptase (RNA-dependent DNA polymerase) [Fructobacillus sp. EFB-N1]
MNSNNYEIAKLNHKRHIYRLNTQSLDEKYRDLAKSLKRTFTQTPNRNRSLNQVVRALTPNLYNRNKHGHYFVTDLNQTIIRGDIHSFFPSINKHLLYKKIVHSTKLVLNKNQRKLLSDMLLDPNFVGIPQGLSISSVFAEIYLEEFDKLMKLTFSECIYIRYVDDFLLICPTQLANKYDFSHIISKLLCKYQLTLSDNKFSVVPFEHSNQFTFLGYHFRREGDSMIIEIDDSKITKLQKRINSYFYDYLKFDSPFEKLYLRLKNIFFGVITLSPTTLKRQNQGIPYAYSHITSFENIQFLINNIEYQLKKCKKLNASKIKSIRKLYFPYSHFDSQKSDAVEILLKQRYNYLNLSIKQIVNLLRTLDSNFVYKNQSKSSLIHLLFYLLYH